MKTMATLLLAFFLTACTSSFDTFEAAKRTCYDQGKKLLYHIPTMEPLACMTQTEYVELTHKWTVAEDPRPSDAQTLAAGMILQGFALRPLIPAMQPYSPPPLPAFAPFPAPRILPPVSCSSMFVGGYAHTDCY